MMEEEEEEEGGGWLISYADLMTLLFAAFVVLYGITPQGESTEILGIIASIRESFVEIPDEIPEPFRNKEVFQGKLIFKEAKLEAVTNPAIKKFKRHQALIKARDRELDELDILLNQMAKGDGIQRSLRKATEFSKDEFGFNIRLFDRIFFKPGQTKVSAAAKNYLLKIGALIQKIERKTIIEGHADRKNSSKLSPLEISALRAENIRTLLIGRSGFKPEQIRTAAYGELRPLHKKDNTKVNHNNRIEIKIIYQ